ncbi:MAG: hypothetical protein GC158_10895 [Cyanobacteria bacterium RI_101]|nr:hypothetical protein [Cyanobacteria bacterium RI_101]
MLLVYLLLGAVYWGLKFVIDSDTRQALGFRWSLDKLEVIFSRYPLKIGENDRLQLRRRLKETVWTRLCNLRAFPEHSWATVTLLCVEEVKYTKGTDTFTEQAEAYSQVVYSHSLPGGESSVNGYFDLEIPPNLGASFEGENNQIRWLLKIEERYGNWLKTKVTYLPFLVDV